MRLETILKQKREPTYYPAMRQYYLTPQFGIGYAYHPLNDSKLNHLQAEFSNGGKIIVGGNTKPFLGHRDALYAQFQAVCHESPEPWEDLFQILRDENLVDGQDKAKEGVIINPPKAELA